MMKKQIARSEAPILRINSERKDYIKKISLGFLCVLFFVFCVLTGQKTSHLRLCGEFFLSFVLTAKVVLSPRHSYQGQKLYIDVPRHKDVIAQRPPTTSSPRISPKKNGIIRR